MELEPEDDDRDDELERLRARVEELEETLNAIRTGEVDALVVETPDGGTRLYTVSGPDTPYQVFVDHMREGALTVDAHGTILYSNACFAVLAGRPLESILGTRLRDYVDVRHADQLGALLAGRSDALEIDVARADGVLVPARWSASVLTEEAQGSQCLVVTEIGVQRHIEQLRALVGVMIDATAQPDIPSALRVLTERACAIVQAHQGMTSVPDPVDRSESANAVHLSEKYARYQGSAASFDRPGIARLVSEQNRSVRLTQRELAAHPAANAAIGRSALPPLRGWLAAPLIAADGSNLGIVQLSDKVSGDFTEQDEVIIRHIAQIGASIVQTKRAERALGDSERRFRQLADSIPQLVWTASSDGSIHWYNRRWYDYTGARPVGTEATNWTNVHPDALPSVAEAWRHSVATGEQLEMEFPIRGADGQYRPFFTLARPLRDDSGRIVLWVGTNTDVSIQQRFNEERNQLLAAERAARTEAERASRMKDEFVATMSHELRTPLNSILGWSYMISHGSVQGAELQHGLETIERNARMQVQMIEDLLDMSRITSGKIRLDVQHVDLDAIVDAAVESIRPAANAKGIRISRAMRTKIDRVLGDPHRLQQVLWNLLSNAVKFTAKSGHVHVAIDSDQAHTEVTVSDDGIGIAPDFLPYVFDRFRQADGSSTRSYSGLGLGLAIVKQLVELHGGTIRAESEGPGRGAKFVLRLPLSPERSRRLDSTDYWLASSRTSQRQNGAATPTLAGITVLYVDDEPDARDLIARVLTDQGAKVLSAGSAAEARALVGDARPDVLLSDIGMPEEDGYSLIRSIRALPADRGGLTPAAAVTALARAEDRDRALQAGFQTHVSKPVETSAVIALVAELAGRAPSRS